MKCEWCDSPATYQVVPERTCGEWYPCNAHLPTAIDLAIKAGKFLHEWPAAEVTSLEKP